MSSSWEEDAGARLWILPGERLYWRGAPDPGVIFGPEDAYLIPFSLLWGGFAIFWEIGVSRQGLVFGMVWGIPFVLIGLYLIFGRFFYKRWNRRRTRYAISDQRIIVTRKRGNHIQAIPLTRPFDVKRRRDGKHVILSWQVSGGQQSQRGVGFLGRTSSTSGLNLGDSWPATSSQRQGSFAFYDITNADQALAAIHAGQ
jgi:hypothetical protein